MEHRASYKLLRSVVLSSDDPSSNHYKNVDQRRPQEGTLGNAEEASYAQNVMESSLDY